MPDITFDPVTDSAALALRWRALEAVSEGGFFRGWTYLGTLLPHFSAPHLLAVRQNGQDVALGLFNRRRGRFSLHETGDPAWDRIYVEHNGLLLRPGAGAVLPAALWNVLARGTLVLSGMDAAHVAAAKAVGATEIRAQHRAPAIDLRALPADYLDSLSANTRAQIRRAMRLCGDPHVEEAVSIEEAQAFFGQLVALHQRSWEARGQPGAFSDSAIRAFHERLIASGVPRGEVVLLRVTAGGRTLGVLYQFRHGGRVLNYQAGLIADADPRLKAGLVCHSMAIGQARRDGDRIYDLLAGAQRYKTSLAPAQGETLHWITVRKPGSADAAIRRLQLALRAAGRAMFRFLALCRAAA